MQLESRPPDVSSSSEALARSAPTPRSRRPGADAATDATSFAALLAGFVKPPVQTPATVAESVPTGDSAGRGLATPPPAAPLVTPTVPLDVTPPGLLDLVPVQVGAAALPAAPAGMVDTAVPANPSAPDARDIFGSPLRGAFTALSFAPANAPRAPATAVTAGGRGAATPTARDVPTATVSAAAPVGVAEVEVSTTPPLTDVSPPEIVEAPRLARPPAPAADVAGLAAPPSAAPSPSPAVATPSQSAPPTLVPVPGAAIPQPPSTSAVGPPPEVAGLAPASPGSQPPADTPADPDATADASLRRAETLELSRAPTLSTDASSASAGHVVRTPDIENLLAQIQRRYRSGSNRIAFLLDPPELGRIEVRLRLERGRVIGEIITESTEVTRVLGADLERVRQALGEAAAAVGDWRVRSRRQDESSYDGRHRRSAEYERRTSGAARPALSGRGVDGHGAADPPDGRRLNLFI